uniref:Potassium two pore domain channel subfamily K member 4 n=1 Tax=Seriola lalandi dorsalis TaxID=1841481 RepID=A0A3B4XWM7_SERLL
MRYTTLLALLTGVMLYLVMGALVFRTLEFPKESSAFEDLLKAKQNFLGNNSCVTELDFHNLLKEVVSAVDAGLDVSSLPANFTSRWDLASAFFFCGTIITTIGFGNLSPRTWYGQLFCVCYALVGIPMFGILLAGVGDHMGTVLRRAVAKIETLFLKRKVRPTTVRVISAVLSILIGCLIFLAVPTVVFQKMEEWSFLESLYFVVITLTTVGFGDFVPGTDTQPHPLVWLWIVFGLAYFASILTMIGNWLRVLSKRTRAERGGTRAADMGTAQEKDKLIPAEKYGSVATNNHKHTPAPGFCTDTSPPAPLFPPSFPPILLPSPPLNTASSASCQLLDFFGENLAYIDESSDTLSDRAQPAASEEKRRRPRKPKRRSMRRQLSHRWSPLRVRRLNSDIQPPSNPPTPPPDSSLSDLPQPEKQTNSAPAL